MKKIFRNIATAIFFYTRIPLPESWIDHKELDKASGYFPLIGWIVGGFGALVFYGCSFILPLNVAVVLSMLSTIWITGAFHEDGLADVVDGFGGGWEKMKILEIMKDSRVGAYGAISLVIIFLLKFSILISFEVSQIPIVLIIAHTISRFISVTFMYTHKYVREDELSKSKPVVKRLELKELFLAGFLGLSSVTLLHSFWGLLIIIPAYISKILLARWFKKWIGGYTGDCLGATQQIVEVVIYLSIYVLWKFI